MTTENEKRKLIKLCRRFDKFRINSVTWIPSNVTNNNKKFNRVFNDICDGYLIQYFDDNDETQTLFIDGEELMKDEQ